jgi:hypothetical protein
MRKNTLILQQYLTRWKSEFGHCNLLLVINHQKAKLHLSLKADQTFSGENPLLQSETALEGSASSVPEEMQEMAANLHRNAPKEISSYAFKMDVFSQVKYHF